MYLRKFFFQCTEHVQIPLEGKVGVKSGNNMKFPHAFLSSVRLFQDIFDAHLIRAGLTFRLAERTELATVDADVRRIDVHVPYEINSVAMLFQCY